MKSAFALELQLRRLLILLFIVVALIPGSLLAANSAYSIFRLQEQISNLYHGVLVIIIGLDEGHVSLLQIKSDMLGHILTVKGAEMQTVYERIKQNERRFSDVLANYKEIGDFPLQVEIMKRRGLDHMISDDHEFITQVRADWIQYQTVSDKVLSLSSQNRNSEAAALAFGEANTRFDKLISSYQKTVDLNKEIAKVLYEESNDVSGQAYVFDAIAFAASLAIAVVIATLLSKKMLSPISEAQQRAKKEMDEFNAETAIVASYRHELGSRSQPADDIREEAPSNMTYSKIDEPIETRKSAILLTEEEQRLFNEILANNQLILLHAEMYNKGIKDKPPSFASLFLDSLTLSLDDYNRSKNYSFTTSSSYPDNHLAVITRAGSNLYHIVRGRKNTVIYLLSVSTMAPITKSAEGLVVISLTNAALIAESVRRTLEEHPSSTIIFDNVTEFINTIGFQKVHSFIQTLSEIVQPYPNSRIILLVNKNAHQPTEIESIANTVNIFVQ